MKNTVCVSPIDAFLLQFGVCNHEIILNITQTCPYNIQQYFTAVKKDNFQMKNCDVFLIFAQNFDCWYTLEPPQSVRRF